MNVASVIANILRREGVEALIAYPGNPLIDAAASVDIRTIFVRQERTGVHIADALGRMRAGDPPGVFAMQFGPGAENAMGAVAQAYAEGVPLVVIPSGYPRALSGVHPNFSSVANYTNFTKWREQITDPDATSAVLRRAFTQARNGRPGPVLVEVPADVFRADVQIPLDYRATTRALAGPDPATVDIVAEALIQAHHPLIYAGQGIHYAGAWAELRELAELLEAPVTTSLEGKSAFPENHSLSLGSGGRAFTGPVHHHLAECDVILGIGCSFGRTNYGLTMPTGKILIHATVDPLDFNKSVASEHQLLGDARLTLRALITSVGERLDGKARGRLPSVAATIASQKATWLQQWMPKLTSDEAPLSPYRVVWDLLHTVDVPNSIITHDAGGPRDQLSPFWEAVTPHSYIGWGKTTQLGYGLGLAMGAKLAFPDRLCVNVWGDAAIGMTGMDLETAVREKLPILSILLNNEAMAIEIADVPTGLAKYGNTTLSGNYAGLARELGCYGERVLETSQIVPAIRRGIDRTLDGQPALLEFMTQKETQVSNFRS